MAVEYRWALHHAHEDAAVRVVVLTGAGDDFCVGAHTEQLDGIGASGGSYQREKAPLPPYPDGTPSELRHNHCFPLDDQHAGHRRDRGRAARAPGSCSPPTPTSGGSRPTHGSLLHSRDWGSPPNTGPRGCSRRQVGLPNAMELLWSPDVFDGVTAAHLGWAQHTAEPGAVLDAALAQARNLARHASPLSLATMKRAVLVDAADDLGKAYARSVADMNAALRHDDFRRGVAAQRAGQRPDFLTT